MSARARRFFGCVLPLTLALFGCGAVALLGYAGQIVFQLVRVDDRSMLPVLEPGWTVLVNNTAFWAQRPLRGSIVSLSGEEGIEFRRLFGVPGDTVEILGGEVYLNGEPSRVFNRAHGDASDFGPLELGRDEYFVLAEDRTYDDSREWGPVPGDDLYGVAMFYFPEGSRSPFPVDPTAVPSPAAGTRVPAGGTPPPPVRPGG
jgi:signal peptidase I